MQETRERAPAPFKAICYQGLEKVLLTGSALWLGARLMEGDDCGSSLPAASGERFLTEGHRQGVNMLIAQSIINLRLEKIFSIIYMHICF